MSSEQPRAFDRRTVIRSAGAVTAGVVGVGALAACGSSVSAAPGGGQQGGGAPGAGPLSVKTSQIPVGGGVIFPEQLVVVTQPTAGQFKAFSATCTHQQCAVTRVEKGKIICPCHESLFDITTGAPTANSPAKRPLPARTATVSGDTVTVATS